MSGTIFTCAVVAKRESLMNNDIKSVLYSEKQLDQAEDKLAAKLTKDYDGRQPVIVSVLTGAVFFTTDMMKKLDFKATLDFIDVSSYDGTESSGQVKLEHDLKHSVKGKDVLVMEDIIDTGRTLQYLLEFLRGRGAKSVKVCAMLDKPAGRKVDVAADYAGLNVPNEFLVGYGLDYNGLYRNLPYIGILKPSVYANN